VNTVYIYIFIYIYIILGGILDVKKMGRALSQTGGGFLGCRKVDFWFPLRCSPKETRNPLFTPDAGLSGQKSIKRTQKYVVLGVFGHFPKIPKRPHAKNIIDTGTASSFEDRSGAAIFGALLYTVCVPDLPTILCCYRNRLLYWYISGCLILLGGSYYKSRVWKYYNTEAEH
jgi:hypothetical protein